MKTSISTGLFLIFCVCSLTISAQTTINGDFNFRDRTNDALNKNKFRSSIAIGVVDLDGDLRDDIVRMEDGRILELQYQLADGTFKTVESGEISNTSQWSICAADIDNDGINELLTGGFLDGIKIYDVTTDGKYAPTTLEDSSDLYTQSSNFVDINGDAVLDFFVCNDEGPSQVWLGDVNGSYTRNDSLIKQQLKPVSDNGGNYSSIWTDFDNDQDLDLYISKCYRDALVTDPRRANQLFINNGDGTFTEDTIVAGLRSIEQSWTADFQDIDNDGDLDCFLVNHYAPCQLFRNNGDGTFEDITEFGGVDVFAYHIQCTMRDFDSDGWIDILVAGNFGHEIFHNTGTGTFTKSTKEFEGYLMSSFAVGDLNHDGRVDIYSSSSSDLNFDRLWTNSQIENNFLAVDLEPITTNANAIGARIEIYGPWGIQLREVRSGEGYGIQNSFVQHFGLGEEMSIDSMIVTWPQPSVQVDKFYDLAANQFITVREGEGLCPDKVIETKESLNLYLNGEVELTAPKGESYLWSTGETTQSILVSEIGSYAVQVTGESGCIVESSEVDVYFKLIVSNRELDQLGLNLVPNPANQYITLQGEWPGSDAIDYQIIDINGRLMKTGNLNTIGQTIGISELVSGIYFFGTTFEGKHYYQRLVVTQ